MAKTGLAYDPIYLRHDPGRDHPERPVRLTSIVEHLKKTGLFSQLKLIHPYKPPLSWISEIHSPGYIEHVEQACRSGARYLDSLDTGVCPDSYEVALMAVGGVLAAVDAVMAGEVDNAFCAVRPPGHHAEADRAMGFCLFNNVAIAARYIQQSRHLDRVLIVDWDVHHGNGTQKAFYADPSVLYFSTHQYPHYPGTGSRWEEGKGEGKGYTINAPMPSGSEDKDYIEAFEDILRPASAKFDPDFVLISAGFDAYRDDPLSGICLSETGFDKLTQIAKAIAEEHCDGRLVSVLEGGYYLPGLTSCVQTHIRTLRGATCLEN